jgi:3D (Asp-Asp-Asp) domain-containing protein
VLRRPCDYRRTGAFIGYLVNIGPGSGWTDSLDRRLRIRTMLAMRKWSAVVLLLVSACLLPRAQTTGDIHTGGQPPDFLFASGPDSGSVPAGRYMGRFKVTFYWAVEEVDYPDSKASALYLADGSLLGRFSSAFIKAFKIEAAAQLRDGRMISYLKMANRAMLVDRYLGCGGHTLTAMKSIAVDPRLIPLGSVVYVPQAEGITVDGQVLNGVFYAHDIGSAIKGKHIDVFIGRKKYMDDFSSAGMGSSGSVDVYVLE